VKECKKNADRWNASNGGAKKNLIIKTKTPEKQHFAQRKKEDALLG
jgi:hypothetical protein